MDEITIDDKIYISSKRAAGITGYAKDYVGQLCREGRVEARLIGRSWYVLEDSIRKHRFEEAGETKTVEPAEPEVSEKTNVEAVWTESVYTSEEVQMLPVSEATEEKVDELPEESIVEEPPVEASIEEPVEEAVQVKEEEVSETEDAEIVEQNSSQQAAWQSWISGTSEQANQESKQEAEEEAVKAPEQDVPVEIHVIEDIQPVAPIHRYEAPQQPHKPLPHKKKSYLIYKAVAVAVIVFCLTIALIGSGAADRFHNNLFTDFLGGTSFVK